MTTTNAEYAAYYGQLAINAGKYLNKWDAPARAAYYGSLAAHYANLVMKGAK